VFCGIIQNIGLRIFVSQLIDNYTFYEDATINTTENMLQANPRRLWLNDVRLFIADRKSSFPKSISLNCF
jgi:hypothetical protein